MSDNVKIDKYVLKSEKSPKVIVFDNSIQRNIVSVNTLSDEHNLALAEMILAELNTGKYEPVDDSPIVDGEVNSTGESGNDNESEDVNGDIESSGDGSVIDGSSVSDGVVDSDMDGE